MKIRNLLLSFFLVVCGFLTQAQDRYFTTTGSCASYITYNNWDSHQEDSIYIVEKTKQTIVVDGVADAAYSVARVGVLNNIMNEQKVGNELDLSNYPQSETDLYATFKALWTETGMYMLIEVKDDMVRYQNYTYQWENDAVELFFSKARGEGFKQLIIPVMVGTAHPSKPAAKDFESGSATGSDPDYAVFGYDANNWDESVFNWAIKKTATGYTMEVYVDKDIATNGNSEALFVAGGMFAGDVNVDEADEKQNSNDPALYVREAIMGMMGNSLHEYASSANYGWFKLVDNTEVEEELYYTTTGSCASYIEYHNWDSHQADSIYVIEKTGDMVTVDGVADDAYNRAHARVLKKIMNERKVGETLDLSVYPQSETDLYATLKALWTDNGVYMFIDVKDDFVRYQNPSYQWENDAIELFFSKSRGDGFKQLIIPAMVGTTNPNYPAALDFESGSAKGSNEDYKVYGYDANNWDESVFNWAIKKTATGYAMEIYLDKDIVTNGNSETHFTDGAMFAGDVNVDEADETQDSGGLYRRESIIGMLGNSLHEYASSANYGWFKLSNTVGVKSLAKNTELNAYYNSLGKEIKIQNATVNTVTMHNITGQAMSVKLDNGIVPVSHLKAGVYILSGKDAAGKLVGSKKIVLF